MANLLREGIEVLTATLKETASETVTYSRGYDSVQVQSIFGKKLLKLNDNVTGGLRIEWTDMDFMIPADADFHFGDGVLIEPRRGDIIWAEGAVGTFEAYEVLPFGSNEPPYRWSDPYRQMYRIHTKHIDTEQFYT